MFLSNVKYSLELQLPIDNSERAKIVVSIQKPLSFDAITKTGYTISLPIFDPRQTEFRLFLEMGKVTTYVTNTFKKMATIAGWGKTEVGLSHAHPYTLQIRQCVLKGTGSWDLSMRLNNPSKFCIEIFLKASLAKHSTASIRTTLANPWQDARIFVKTSN